MLILSFSLARLCDDDEEKEEKKNKLWLMELGIGERREKDIEVDVVD